VAAVVALFEMAAQGSGATDFDGVHHALLVRRQRVLVPVGRAVLVEDVGDLQDRPGGAADGRRGAV
jgi:hypothetical protein